jgi:hypothetical protein
LTRNRDRRWGVRAARSPARGRPSLRAPPRNRTGLARRRELYRLPCVPALNAWSGFRSGELHYLTPGRARQSESNRSAGRFPSGD